MGLKKVIMFGISVITASLILYTGIHVSKASSKAEQEITIYLAGDSTVSNYPASLSPRSGWGQELSNRFDSHVTVINQAKPGRSSKSFIDEGRLQWILHHINKGDYLFIQFGHNDEKRLDPSRYTNPSTTYKSYLKQYIQGARGNGAIPILVTPVERMSFSVDGMAQASHGEYPKAMKELASEENVPVIDLTAKSRELFQQLGPEQTKTLFMWLKAGEYPHYPDGAMDSTHFRKNGAIEIASLVIEGIDELDLPLQEYVRKVDH
ncbi:rhamnogalacturonan acetylesterase [Bacillus sp. S3]|uniref:rhamnogalacturonan acetylesterase n=1 Tax=Bacillus sp. S3 TaxID=486398 RepID=UPI001CC1E7D9|nr:rhamnogalacturonan acetylesterase [Bacillus sp. S3]